METSKNSRYAGKRFNETINGVFWLIVEEREFSALYEIYPDRSIHNERDVTIAKNEIKKIHAGTEKKAVFYTTWTIKHKSNLI